MKSAALVGLASLASAFVIPDPNTLNTLRIEDPEAPAEHDTHPFWSKIESAEKLWHTVEKQFTKAVDFVEDTLEHITGEVEDKFEHAVDYSYETSVQYGRAMQAASAPIAWLEIADYDMNVLEEDEPRRDGPSPPHGPPSDGSPHHGSPHEGAPPHDPPSDGRPPPPHGPSHDRPPPHGTPGDDGPSRGGPPRDGPDHDGPDHDGPSRGGPSRGGPPRDGPDHNGPDHDGPSRGGPSRGGPPRDGPDHDGPSRGGPSRGGPDRDSPPRDGPFHDGPSHGGPSRGGPPRDGPDYDGPNNDGPSHGGPSRGGLDRDGPPRDGPSRGGPSRDGPDHDGPSHGGPSRGGPSCGGPPRNGPDHDSHDHDGPSHSGPSRDGPRRDGPPSHGPSRGGPSRGGPSQDGPRHDGPPPHGPPHHGPPYGGPLNDGPQGGPDHHDLASQRPRHPPHHGKPNQTIYELISKSNYTTKLAAAINEFPDLVELLNGTEANYTLFAPSDRAFDKIPEHAPEPSKEFLKKLLQYHISPDFYPIGWVFASRTIPTTLDAEFLSTENEAVPQRLSTQIGFRGLSVNFYSHVVAVDIFATNGVIHGVDSILLPPPKAAKILGALPSEFSTLELALTKTGLIEKLSDTSSHVGGTLFAPSNFAFHKLGPRINAFLFSAPGLKYLKALLLYHLAPNTTLYSDAIYKSDTSDPNHDGPSKGVYHVDLHTALHDRSLSVDIVRFGRLISVKINGFNKVVVSDGIAADGVIHVVPSVLIPPKTPGGHGLVEGDIDLDEFTDRLAPYIDDAEEDFPPQPYTVDDDVEKELFIQSYSEGTEQALFTPEL